MKFCEGDLLVLGVGMKCKWGVPKTVRKHSLFVN